MAFAVWHANQYSAAEQSRAEQSRAEQSTEQSRAVSRAEQSRADTEAVVVDSKVLHVGSKNKQQLCYNIHIPSSIEGFNFEAFIPFP